MSEGSEVPEPFTVGTLQRRAPFGDNPDVGTRGTRTQERILRAALEVFGEVGYHDCGVDRITAKATCSRPSFYQYFSSKEDLFRRLCGELARRLFELASAPDPITPDEDGWKAVRAYVTAYGDLFEVYSPVFRVFSTAVVSDDAVVTGASRVFVRQADDLLARVESTSFRRARRAHAVVEVLLNGVTRTQRFRQVLEEGGVPGFDRARIDDALADVLHRALFGPIPGLNVRQHVAMAAEPALLDAPAPLVRPPAVPGQSGRRTRNRLLDAGREVFAARGYHDARVDDIVGLAETSHGTFYRYFDNKQALFRILAARSGRRVVGAVDELPPASAPPAELRRWVRRYFDLYRAEGPIMRAWVEAEWGDPELGAASPAAVDALRQRLARFLAPRAFGDIDADALVLMALLDRSDPQLDADVSDAALVDAFLHVLQRALLPAD